MNLFLDSLLAYFNQSQMICDTLNIILLDEKSEYSISIKIIAMKIVTQIITSKNIEFVDY